MLKSIHLVLILFFTSFIITAQNLNKGNIKQKKYFEKISYTIFSDQIVIPVTINNKNYNFILDTGAPFAISEKLQKELGISASKEINLTDINQKTEKINTILVPKFAIGEITFINSKGIVFSDSHFLFDCLNIDGIIGSNILRNSVLQFDFQNQSIYITDNTNNLKLQNALFQELYLNEIQSDPSIEVFFENDLNYVHSKAVLDSGANHFFSFPFQFLEDLPNEIKIFETISSHQGANTLGFYGIADKNLITLLSVSNFIVNQSIFKNVVFETNKSSFPNIGNQLYTYGKTTLDYKQKRFYFERYLDVGTEILSQKPLAVNPTFIDGKFVVDIIWDKSLEVQINVGDEILSVDGIDFTSLSFCNFLKTNKNSNKNSVILELKDIKTGQFKRVEVNRL